MPALDLAPESRTRSISSLDRSSSFPAQKRGASLSALTAIRLALTTESGFRLWVAVFSSGKLAIFCRAAVNRSISAAPANSHSFGGTQPVGVRSNSARWLMLVPYSGAAVRPVVAS